MKSLKKYAYIGIPILGVLFYICYLHRSAIDMIYSDYIRLINSYLPDIWNLKKFFVPDLLTRMPISYLGRAVNVSLFGYSVTFDRMLSILSFGVSALIIGVYSRKHEIGLGWFSAMMVFLFSLNKWEMLYNSTGWCHFMAFACFFYHYLVLDRMYQNEGCKGDFLRLMILPAFTTIFVAGPYCAIYSMTLFLAYGFVWLTKGKSNVSNRQLIVLFISVLVPLFAFIWSNSQAVYEHSGAVEGSMIGTFFQEPEFFLKFFLKSFASMVFGVEFISRHLSNVPDLLWYLLGLLVLASYFFALWMNFYYGVYKESIFPLMLLAGGGMNHLIVLVSRWIFMKESYGMSSRYALQYQIGILGIFLTFGLVYRKKRKKSVRKGCYQFAVLVSAIFVIGNAATTADEYDFGQHRKNHNLEVKEVLLDFENQDEETLQNLLEYHKPGTREALQILKENQWNIFRENQ